MIERLGLERELRNLDIESEVKRQSQIDASATIRGGGVAKLLMLNFGTFAETNRFKTLAFETGFLSTDLMDEERPPGLLRPKGLREVKTGGSRTISFYEISDATWNSAVSPGRIYRREFGYWMANVLQTAPDCVYLTGHHSNCIMWGGTNFAMRMPDCRGNQAGNLRFGIGTKIGTIVVDVPGFVEVSSRRLREQCKLVLGFGCNIAHPRHAAYYRTFFSNGRRSPILLGWNDVIAVPRVNWPSVNSRFFGYIRDYANRNRELPTNNRLSWLYEHQPLEIVRAWGHGVLAYRGHPSQSRLWDNARAWQDGTQYAFLVRNRSAEPVAM